MLVVGNTYVYYCAWVKSPHDKIGFCVCAARNWVFWFNKAPRSHGIGQMPVAPDEFRPVLTIPSWLDLSSVKAMDDSEIRRAADRGPLPAALRARVMAELGVSNRLLPAAHQAIALANLR